MNDHIIHVVYRSSLYSAVYTISVGGVMLDARVDAICNNSIVADLVTAANIEGVAGVYEIVTTAMSVSRVERTMSLLVTGLVATADMTVMSEVLQVIVRTQHSSKSTSHLSASTFPPVPACIMTCQCFLSSAISVVIWFLAVFTLTRARDYKEILSMDWCSTHDFVLNKQKTQKW